MRQTMTAGSVLPSCWDHLTSSHYWSSKAVTTEASTQHNCHAKSYQHDHIENVSIFLAQRSTLVEPDPKHQQKQATALHVW